MAEKGCEFNPLISFISGGQKARKVMTNKDFGNTRDIADFIDVGAVVVLNM